MLMSPGRSRRSGGAIDVYEFWFYHLLWASFSSILAKLLSFSWSIWINDRCCLDVFVCLRIWGEVKQYLPCFTKHMLGIRGLIMTFICFAYPLLWLFDLGLWFCYSFNSCLRLVFHNIMGAFVTSLPSKKKKKKAFTQHRNKSCNSCNLLATDQVLPFWSWWDFAVGVSGGEGGTKEA